MSDRESRPKKTVIGSFLGRLGRSKSRGADLDRKKEKNGVSKETPPVVVKSVPVSKSDGNIKNGSAERKSSPTSHRETAASFLAEEARMSPARRLFNRFSTFRSTARFRSASSRASNDSLNENGLEVKTASEHDLLAPRTPKTTRGLAPPSGVPTGAQSETDLRFVTTRDSHRSVPSNAPFGFGESPRAFMSENDLASSSADPDFPEVNRTPSYLRISCALNGYTKSPKKLDLMPKGEAHVLGESLVERRSRMFSMPQERKPAAEFNSPMSTAISSASKSSEVECSTPVAPPLQNNRLHALQMGNNVSTPAPIRDLIGKFEQLDLCSAHKHNEKEGVENIEPHKFVINQQPDFDEIDLKSKDTNGNEEEKDLKVSTDAESDSGISGSSPASSKKNVEILKEKEDEVTTTTPSDGQDFLSLHKRVKEELEAKMEAAVKDLEKADDLPDKCADSLRIANGNAQLLVRKKFPKFKELIEKNLNPVANDQKPVTTEDLEGFWTTIDIELKGIMEEFAKVEAYRAANWDPSAVQDNPEPDTTAAIVPKPRPTTARKPKVPVLSEEAKKKLQDQRAAAEQRRAEMRAQIKMKAMAAKEQNPPDLEISESS